MSSLMTLYMTLVTLFLCGSTHAQGELPWNGERFAKLVSDTNEILDVLDVNNTLRFSDKCSSAMRKFTSAFTAGQDWAWRMADAWGYQPSGTFLGDGMWEGSYEGCIRTPSRPPYITGHHCVVRWHGAMTNDGIGVCVPKDCSVYDVKVLLVTGSQKNKISLPYKFTPYIGGLHGYCSVPVEDKPLDGSAIAAIVILSLFALIVFASTTYDVIVVYCRPAASSRYTNDNSKVEEDKNDSQAEIDTGNVLTQETDTAHASNGGTGNTENIQLEPKEEETRKYGTIDAEKGDQKQITETLCSEFLVSFSLCRHIPRILSFEQGKGSIPCLHGIRALAFAWIVLGHSWQLGITLTSANTVSNQVFNQEQTAWKQIIDRMSFAVEGFFILSGMLTAISLLKKFEKGQFNCKAVPYYIFHRWWRLTPVYMLIVMFYGCLFPYLGSGPFYNPHLGDVEGCKTGWWWNILYINNFWWGRSHDCLGWSWYLANDFQFYLVSPLFVLALVKKPKLGIGIIIGFIVSCMVIRGVLFGILPSDFGTFFTQIYTPPYGRSSTYLLGMLTGYFLLKKQLLPIRMHKALLCFLWILMLGLISLVIFLPFTNRDNSWNVSGSLFLGSIDRTMFGAGVCWIIIACISNNGGIINVILSWNGWLPISRVSYVGYLIHPIIIYFTYYTSPVQLYLTRWLMVYYFIGHFVLTCVVSMFVSACLEIPFGKLESIMMKAIQRKRE